MEKDIDKIGAKRPSLNTMKVVDLYEKGLELQVFAYHKTSIEAIKELAETGKLPFASMFEGHLEYKRGDDPEIWAKPEHMKSGQLPKHMGLSDGPSKYFAILEKLPFEPTEKEDFYKFCDDSQADENSNAFVAEALKNGMTKMELERLFNEMISRQGVVIGISADLERDFGPDAAEGENAPFRYAELADGLPIEYINGIEPLGDYESNALNAMQAEVEEAIEAQEIQETDATPPRKDLTVNNKILDMRSAFTRDAGLYL